MQMFYSSTKYAIAGKNSAFGSGYQPTAFQNVSAKAAGGSGLFVVAASITTDKKVSMVVWPARRD